MDARQLFGHFDLAALYLEIINAETRDLPLQEIDRQVLFTVICLTDLDNGICYEPLRFKPASTAIILGYSRLDSSVFHQSFERLLEQELLRYIRERDRSFLVMLDASLQQQCAAAVRKTPRRFFLLDRPSAVAADPPASINDHAGFVLIYQLANGYYWLEHSAHGRDLSPKIARELGFAVELMHRIPANDHQQAHALLTARYAHCRHLQRWYLFAPVELRELLALRTIMV